MMGTIMKMYKYQNQNLHRQMADKASWNKWCSEKEGGRPRYDFPLPVFARLVCFDANAGLLIRLLIKFY